jgi:hypothetical protein
MAKAEKNFARNALIAVLGACALGAPAIAQEPYLAEDGIESTDVATNENSGVTLSINSENVISIIGAGNDTHGDPIAGAEIIYNPNNNQLDIYAAGSDTADSRVLNFADSEYVSPFGEEHFASTKYHPIGQTSGETGHFHTTGENGQISAEICDMGSSDGGNINAYATLDDDTEIRISIAKDEIRIVEKSADGGIKVAKENNLGIQSADAATHGTPGMKRTLATRGKKGLEGTY